MKEQSQISISDRDDLDNTVIADIAEEESNKTNIQEQENEENQSILDVTVTGVKPQPEPQETKNIDEIVDSYEAEKAVIHLESKNEDIVEKISWDKAKKIAYWYEDESKVSSLIGSKIKYDKHTNVILCPVDPRDYLNIISHLIVIKMIEKNVLIEDDTDYSLKFIYIDFSLILTCILSSISLHLYLDLFGNMAVSEVSYPVITGLTGIILGVVFSASLIFTIFSLGFKTKSVLSSFRQKFLRKD